MATTATVTVSSDIAYSVVEEVDQFNVNRYSNSLDYSLIYNYGTGQLGSGVNSGTPTTSQVNLFVKSSGTISGGEHIVLDFKSYPKFNIGLESTISFSGLRGLVVENSNSGTGELLNIRATGSNAFTNIFNGGSGNLNINPLGTYLYTDIYDTQVTPTNKLLYIHNDTSTGIDYQIVAVGVDPSILVTDSIGTP